LAGAEAVLEGVEAGGGFAGGGAGSGGFLGIGPVGGEFAFGHLDERHGCGSGTIVEPA
jgi:hypothetical protein